MTFDRRIVLIGILIVIMLVATEVLLAWLFFAR